MVQINEFCVLECARLSTNKCYYVPWKNTSSYTGRYCFVFKTDFCIAMEGIGSKFPNNNKLKVTFRGKGVTKLGKFVSNER